ncbi:hypothetical protein GQX73_g10232 [Xylaria multiplex]|uniref:Xylanolytic transcriptional activator regulatory domain-containing protein n=1 Tax=Xylaria multiplex TaxID=323545 RepID=A0A7C8IGU8_9PEZI|nr:hypothetical protein GQX73_g10232 [Xylaria multiplex]
MQDDCVFKVGSPTLYMRPDQSCAYMVVEVISSSLAIFSEDRLHVISRRLGHNQVRELIDTIFHDMQGRACPSKAPAASGEDSTLLHPVEFYENHAEKYINAYFEYIHPLYPFLDQTEFKMRASNPQFIESPPHEPAFPALYHTVLALGCQYLEDRSFDPDSGPSYKLFRVALKLLPSLLVSSASLPALQAVTAMALFGMTIPGIRFEETLINEAARLAMRLDPHRVAHMGGTESTYYRTFWVVYVIEKMSCFLYGKTTIMADYDIGCPVPDTPESYFGGYNTFIALLRGCRILSKAQQLLFSVKATMNSTTQYFDSIDLIRQDLNRWAESIPPRLEPGLYVETNNAWVSFAALRLHCIHRVLEISLCRLEVHVGGNARNPRLERARLALLNAARTVLQQTAYIDLKPYTPLWMIGAIPYSAVLILFDFIIHNPSHHDTDSDLALLDKAAGYFGRLQTHNGKDSETAIPTPPTGDAFNMPDMRIADFAALPSMPEEQLFYPVTESTSGDSEYPLPDFSFLDLFNPTADYSASP